MKIQYQTIREKSALIQKYSGTWDINNLDRFVDFMIVQPEWKEVKKHLLDLRDLTFTKLEDSDFERLLDIRIKMKSDHLMVLIVDKPLQTAYTLMYAEKLRAAGFNCEFCSTMNYAIGLLGIQAEEKEMERLISRLEEVEV